MSKDRGEPLLKDKRIQGKGDLGYAPFLEPPSPSAFFEHGFLLRGLHGPAHCFERLAVFFNE